MSQNKKIQAMQAGEAFGNGMEYFADHPELGEIMTDCIAKAVVETFGCEDDQALELWSRCMMRQQELLKEHVDLASIMGLPGLTEC